MTEHNYLSDQPMKHFIVYKTTNLINNRFYIGVHAQIGDPMEFDGYFGSGVAIRKAVEKNGEDKFTRETLFVFDDAQSAYDKEAEIVNDEFLLEYGGICYNMKHGGIGAICVDGERNPMFGKTGNQHPRFGTTHTDDTKSKMSEKAKLRCENGEWMDKMIKDRTGRTVVHNETEERSVKSEELESLLTDGWVLGQLPAFTEYNSKQRKSKNMERRCVDFGVETEGELKSLIEDLYIVKNLTVAEIIGLYPKVSEMGFKTIRKNLGIPSKTREQWQSTRSDKK